ncbi:MAG: cobalamin-binding protein [Burkholderiales bacterium]|nr:MAG: cobalamin-binding protein [Burkholderiales bacterium]
MSVRIVSLVPSLTELLCALGLREQLVGRTGFCIHPREALRDVPKVGGTKDVDVERVRQLAPTHLVVNVDENDRSTVERLAGSVPNVIVTHPLTVQGNLALFERFGTEFGEVAGVRQAAAALSQRLRAAIDAARARRFEPLPVLYLIWKDPWMSVGRDTFIASMLAEAGLRSVIRASEPRYPSLALAQIADSGAHAVLLSSEPYRFGEAHCAALRKSLAGLARLAPAGDRPASGVPLCATIDGEMVSWYGSRAIDGLYYLIDYRERLERALDAVAAHGGMQ